MKKRTWFKPVNVESDLDPDLVLFDRMGSRSSPF